MANYDVFISYRRDSGSAEARLLQLHLKERHIRCFLDVTELGRGYFDEALLRHIEQTPNFVVILSPDSLNRSENDEDWLRREIAHALATERNVVPLMLPKFEFPAHLPEDIRNLPRCQGVEYSHRYIDAMLEKLIATLDLPAAAAPEPAPTPPPLPDDPLERTRAERTLLAEEREKLAQARLSAERLRDETDELRRRIELRNAEKARQLREGSAGGGGASGGWSERTVVRDFTSSAEVRQGAVVAFWLSLLSALALLAAPFSGSAAQIGLIFGGVFLALALWVRINPAQGSTGGLAVGGLLTIVMATGVFSQRVNASGLWFLLLAGASTTAFWRVSRAIRAASPVQAADPPSTPATPMPFGARAGRLIGVAGDRMDANALRLFAGARLAAALALALLLASHFPNYNSDARPLYLDIAWVAVALPLALALTFRWLRHPLLSLVVAAVLAGLVNPLFWRGPWGTVVVVQELAGVLLFAAAVEEIEVTGLALWCGSAGATLAGALLYRLAGYQAATLFYGASPGELMLLPSVFTVVLLSASSYMRRPTVAPAP